MMLRVCSMIDCTYFEAKGIDYKGQLQKIKKSPTRLQPLFEALTNSMEAIKLVEGTSKNEITISLNFVSDTLDADTTKEYKLSNIIFEDCGIGFNNKEYSRFENLHDNSKGFSNQGSGRIQYLHFFKETQFKSVYKNKDSSTGFYQRVFTLSKSESFLANDAILCYHDPIEVEATESYSKIVFQTLLEEEDQKYYNNLSVQLLKETIVDHYLYYFCENRNSMPKIYINSIIDKKIHKQEEITSEDIPTENKSEEVKVQYQQLSEDNKLVQIDKEETFYIKAFRLNKIILHANSLKLTSKHEIIKGAIAKKIELDILKPDDIINGNRYLFLVSSEYIDGKDNDNRGDIEIYTEEEFKKDTSLFKEHEVILLDDIQSKVNAHILSMYKEILEIKNKHKLDVDKLQKMFLLDKKTLSKIKINPQDTDEIILKKVYRADVEKIAEKDAKIKQQIDSLNDYIDNLNELNPATKEYKEYEDALETRVSSLVETIPLQNKIALTHTVARRKLVLELFQKILDRELKIQLTSKKSIDEKLLHNLIFQQTSDNPNKSDLWLINEDFIYFKGTSEGTLGDIKINDHNLFKDNLSEEENNYRLKQQGDAKLKRPDVLLFPDEGKCILIEFKAPNVSVSDHLNQLNMYASLINNLSKEEYGFHTFYGYLIGENIDIDDIEDKDADFIEAYNFNYMFRPHKRIAGRFNKIDGSLYTEVIKYSTLLERAKKRNEIFISKILG